MLCTHDELALCKVWICWVRKVGRMKMNEVALASRTTEPPERKERELA